MELQRVWGQASGKKVKSGARGGNRPNLTSLPRVTTLTEAHCPRGAAWCISPFRAILLQSILSSTQGPEVPESRVRVAGKRWDVGKPSCDERSEFEWEFTLSALETTESRDENLLHFMNI